MFGKFIAEKLHLPDGSLSPEGEAFFTKHLVKEPQMGMVGLDLREYESLDEKQAAALAQFIKQNKNNFNLGYVGVQIDNAEGIKAVTKAVVNDTKAPCVYLDLGKSPLNLEAAEYLRSACLQKQKLGVLWNYEDEMAALKNRAAGGPQGTNNMADIQYVYAVDDLYKQMAQESRDNVKEWTKLDRDGKPLDNQNHMWPTTYLERYVEGKAQEKANKKQRQQQRKAEFRENKNMYLALALGSLVIAATWLGFKLNEEEPKEGPSVEQVNADIKAGNAASQQRLKEYDALIGRDTTMQDTTPAVTTQSTAINTNTEPFKPETGNRLPAYVQRQQAAKVKAQVKAIQAKKAEDALKAHRDTVQQITKSAKTIEPTKPGGLKFEYEVTGNTAKLKSLPNAMQKVERPPVKPSKHHKPR